MQMAPPDPLRDNPILGAVGRGGIVTGLALGPVLDV